MGHNLASHPKYRLLGNSFGESPNPIRSLFTQHRLNLRAIKFKNTPLEFQTIPTEIKGRFE
jgi:hypothetical protein